MVSVLVSSAVDRGFAKTKIGICCFSYKHAALRRKKLTGWLGIGIMCPSGVTCLPAETVVLVS